ncbi:peptide-methionine (S)-S-oxide reductase [uncultured Nostoc sp.]
MQNANLQKATFGAGCFWGVEAAFRQVKGVIPLLSLSAENNL